jgi:hypothetical protein
MKKATGEYGWENSSATTDSEKFLKSVTDK